MRVANWPQKLAAEVDAANEREFEWGSHDCCQFAARCVAAVIGSNPTDPYPRYNTTEQAEQMVDSFGGFEALFTKLFGEPKHPAFAKRGDLVLVEMGNGLQPAVCLGVWCVAPSLNRQRLEKRMTDTAVLAWSIE